MERIAKELLKIAKQIQSGATGFSKFGKGTDAKRVFRDLQEAARREYGEDRYSGTIGAKDSFKLVAEPMPLKGAQEVARKMGDKADKWGPAFGVPVVGESKGRLKDVKKAVKSKSSREAVEALNQMLNERYKGFVWEWETKPKVELLKGSAITFKTQKGAKPAVVYKTLTYKEYPTLKEAVDATEAHIKTAIQENWRLQKEYPITAEVSNATRVAAKVTFDFRSKEGNKYQVSGKIKVSKPSKKIIGYFFFGEAPT